MPTEPTAYAKLHAHARALLRRFSFPERERLLAEVVLDWSYRLGRADAIIPRQEIFVTLTGISKGNVSERLKGLERAGVLIIDRQSARYTFNVDASAWRGVDCRLRSLEAVGAADRAEAWLDRLAAADPAQLHLIEPPLDFKGLLAGTAREEVLSTFQRPSSQPQPSGVIYTDGRQASHPAHPDAGANPEPSDSHARGSEVPFSPESAAAFEQVRQSIADSFASTAASEFPDREPASSQIGNSPLSVLDGSNSSHLDAVNGQFPNREHGNRETLPAVATAGSPASGGLRGSRPAVASGKIARENELLEQIEELTRDTRYSGFWRLRIREDRVSVVEAIAELRLRLADTRNKHLRNRGGWLRDRFKRFHAEAIAAAPP